MEWLALATWALVALVVLPVGGGAFTAPALGTTPLVGGAGLVLAILFAIFGTPALAWVAAGLGVAGAALTGLGAARLMAEDASGGALDENAATFAGAAWPLLLVAGALSALAALAADGVL